MSIFYFMMGLIAFPKWNHREVTEVRGWSAMQDENPLTRMAHMSSTTRVSHAAPTKDHPISSLYPMRRKTIGPKENT
jgi:hypothetical protein